MLLMKMEYLIIFPAISIKIKVKYKIELRRWVELTSLFLKKTRFNQFAMIVIAAVMLC